jgi:anti-sigma-K factor RskA
VSHEQAWQRLPDLLEDRDDPELLAHVRGCTACQRQLFLLGRVDRLLRDEAQARLPRRRTIRRAAAAVAMVAAAAAVLLAFLVPRGSHPHAFVLRTASGRSVGQAAMLHADARNVSLSLVARGLPPNRQHMFVLWAAGNGSSMEVGHFMVDRSGGCRVRFNLPASHSWSRFWVSEPGNAAVVVAST